MRSPLFPFDSWILCPHSVTPLGPAQSKLSQRRPQKCPPFCSSPSRFRASVPAHSGPALSSLSWASSFGPMLEAPPLFFCFSVRSPSGASLSLKPPDSLPGPRSLLLVRVLCLSSRAQAEDWPRNGIQDGGALGSSLTQTPYLRHGCPLVWFLPPWSEDLVVLLK